MNFRVGYGYDIHRLEKGRRCVIGGVEIPSEKGLLGHSDADVLLHAITDALLGSLALGDIGQHFPDNDPQWKDADSRQLLKEVMERVEEKGWKVHNLDSTVIAEEPKLSSHIVRIRESIANLLGLQIDQVSVKATTHEKLGPTGRGAGISAHAVLLIRTDQI